MSPANVGYYSRNRKEAIKALVNDPRTYRKDSGYQIKGKAYSDSVGDITPESVESFYLNAHLRLRINNFLPNVFPAPPEIRIVDQNDDEPDPHASEEVAQMLSEKGIYESMRRSFLDTLLYGASVKVVVWGLDGDDSVPDDQRMVVVKKIKDIPAINFRQSPPHSSSNECISPNSLMPGLVVSEGFKEAWITNPYSGHVERMDNWDVIINPQESSPFGSAFCLPLYPLLESISFADRAADLSVQRKGVPLLGLKINDDFPEDLSMSDVNDVADRISTKWGAMSSFCLPRGLSSVPIYVLEGMEANERIRDLDAIIDSFFSPVGVLSPEKSGTQSLFGTSQASMATVWRQFISSHQAWIERAYEQLFDKIIGFNGWPDNWKLEIRFDRPEEESAGAMKLQELQLASSLGVITVREVRERLTHLNLSSQMPQEPVAGVAQSAPANPMTGAPADSDEDVFGGGSGRPFVPFSDTTTAPQATLEPFGNISGRAKDDSPDNASDNQREITPAEEKRAEDIVLKQLKRDEVIEDEVKHDLEMYRKEFEEKVRAFISKHQKVDTNSEANP